MKEHPILFSGEMVRAILDGRKTQTRRVIKFHTPAYSNPEFLAGCDLVSFSHENGAVFKDRISFMVPIKCQYGAPGDTLWVREAWKETQGEGLAYRATEPYMDGEPWRPSIFMPRWASRIALSVKNVRVERVQNISQGDAMAEGTQGKHSFAVLWDIINAKRGFGWDINSWVWVVEFDVNNSRQACLEAEAARGR